MAKSKLHIGFLLGLALLTTACTEEIIMDMPEGRKRPVVEGSITDEFKRHEVILSYSSEMYDTDDPEMISGAEVYVRIGSDTIWFYEQDNKPGHYLSDSVSGRRNRAHHLEINVKENTLYSRPIRMYADTKMSNNARGIDSVGLLPLRNEEGLPFVDDEAAVCVCPYFQTLSDASIVYNVELSAPRSIFLFKDGDGKFFFGPVWDWDAAYDFSWSDMYTGHTFFRDYRETVMGSNPLKQNGNYKLPAFFTDLFACKPFVERYKEVWNMYSDSIVSRNWEQMEKYLTHLNRGPLDRDLQRFPLSGFKPANETAKMKKWLENRRDFMDNLINNIPHHRFRIQREQHHQHRTHQPRWKRRKQHRCRHLRRMVQL